MQALCRRAGHESWLPAFIKVAAIGTLADVVPLVGENRVIAKLGLELLTRGPHKVGLRALLDVAGLTGKTIDSFHVSFMLAPRLNAAGRMSTPDIATRLLLASDEALGDEVRLLAQQLDGENVKRQEEEAGILAAAKKIVQTDPAVGAHTILVVAGEGWHRGVIGIVASKLVDAFHRPAIVLSIDGDVAHGSCRSIPGFDMLGALERSSDLLIRFGGHKQAAGLTMDSARVKELRAAVNAVADETLGPNDLMPRLRIDGDLGFRAITGAVASGIPGLAPFGAGNPRPVFAARRRGDRGRPAQAQGAASQDDAQAGRPDLSRGGLARGRAPRLSVGAQGGARRRVLARTEPVQWSDIYGADAGGPQEI